MAVCGPILQMSLTDAGPGIPAELRKQVFEKLFRVEPHLGQEHNGVRSTGIGLYLCRRIAKVHRSSVRCEASKATLAHGFLFHLPQTCELQRTGRSVDRTMFVESVTGSHSFCVSEWTVRSLRRTEL